MQFNNFVAKTIHFRLVNEDDAEFICNLRNTPELNKHISKSTAIVDDQIRWIENYKKRENEIQEFYFIIERNDNNERIGTIRIYDFRDKIKSFCWGSWILNSNKTRYAAIESALLIYRIAFDELGFEQSHFDVRKDNLSVHKFHMKLGAIHISENDLDNFYIYPKSKYLEALQRYKNFLE
ncbi:GNAT family N-acetyltransferase [Acinetobacter brisouii]|uniref:GNAT family N-acetyltransferase n=1 Tax=Acinetobacter brisouii TaxID=396323 RepID=UPI0005F81F27|nr:GNAT family N-acetyltransferase [Acinetobacter brisouii]KJV41245.1 butyryltransferase [Acinetobacter brisouii]